MLGRGRGRHNHAERHDHLHRRIDAHLELDRLRARHHHDEPGGRIRRGRDEYAHLRLAGVLADERQVTCSLKADAPDALAWIFDQQHFLERISLVRQDRGRETLDAAVERAYERDAIEQVFPQAHEAAADDVAHQHAGEDQQQHRQHQAESRYVYSEQRLGPHRCRQQQQRLVHQVEDEAHHQHGDEDRHPYQQTRYDIAAHEPPRGLTGQRPPRRLPALRLAARGCRDAALLPAAARRETFRVVAAGCLGAGVDAAVSVLPALLLSALASALLSVLPSALVSLLLSVLPSASAAAVSGLLSAPLSVLADESSLSLPARLRLLSFSVLKSVSYQPEPLRRNTGAEISFLNVFLPHEGHFFSGLSVIFCNTSE